ncbi:MAG: SET domain-containing protein [Desulfobacterales bacterium]|nr:SET domain-containing protein [Desulfobacterales bacterium]MCP4162937.1 SET domain-containing protein [Deltaproteobacteria bacterium]
MSKEIYRTKEEIRKFFEKNNIKYQDRTSVRWRPILKKELYNSDYYVENQECFDEITEEYEDKILNSEMPPIYIKKVSEKIGYGVFADMKIRKNAFIGEYAGIVQLSDPDSYDEENNEGYETDYTWYYLDDDYPDLEINGRFVCNEMRFVNHSNNANVDVEHTLIDGQWIIFFKAKRTIKKDEEILISYGEAYWEEGVRELA